MTSSQDKRPMIRVSAKQMFQLTNFVQQHYTASQMSDRAFAEHASRELGFPISDSSVATARETLDIPSNRDAQRAQRTAEPTPQAVADLQARVQRLETKLTVIIAFCQKAGPTSDLSGLAFSLKD